LREPSPEPNRKNRPMNAATESRWLGPSSSPPAPGLPGGRPPRRPMKSRYDRFPSSSPRLKRRQAPLLQWACQRSSIPSPIRPSRTNPPLARQIPPSGPGDPLPAPEDGPSTVTGKRRSPGGEDRPPQGQVQTRQVSGDYIHTIYETRSPSNGNLAARESATLN